MSNSIFLDSPNIIKGKESEIFSFLDSPNIIKGKESELSTFLDSPNIIKGKESELSIFLDPPNIITVLPSIFAIFLDSPNIIKGKESEKIQILGNQGNTVISITEQLIDGSTIVGINALADYETVIADIEPSSNLLDIPLYTPSKKNIRGIEIPMWGGIELIRIRMRIKTLPEVKFILADPALSNEDLAARYEEMRSKPHFLMNLCVENIESGKYVSVFDFCLWNTSQFWNPLRLLGGNRYLNIKHGNRLFAQVIDDGYGVLGVAENGDRDKVEIFISVEEGTNFFSDKEDNIYSVT